MKLIDLHKEWCEKRIMCDNGLCAALPKSYRGLFWQFYPNEEELAKHLKEGYGGMWWGRLLPKENVDEYTPLRQTIVLLICAMNNEL